MDITRCCKHIGHTPPTKRELVLLLVGSVISTDPTLTAHIAMVTSNPTGLGMCFEDTTTNLMLADPSGSTKYKPKGKQKRNGTSISSTLLGRGGTGVDLQWYPAKEFKNLIDVQRDELTNWRNSDEGKAVIADGRAKAKAKQAKFSKGGNDNKIGGGDAAPKRNSVRYQNQVEMAAKKLLASSLEAKKVKADAMDAQLDAVIQRRGGANVGATGGSTQIRC